MILYEVFPEAVQVILRLITVNPVYVYLSLKFEHMVRILVCLLCDDIHTLSTRAEGTS